ncbi:exodeoxyribonuclease V subunit beta [Colwellia hornerae]|uniref:RecBCD enzyme subunit RecB n=1 Tax=Colwellia hornerae TaxID=89402 RepID=A0A5C6Q8C5_9GAMM|nr:exodeoxyribonuclease V subunit beta [Colwellia hornerae]TWX57770.1 exodeoxyribonuclease V subunit beta [Colwellia hornerae]TWX62499.1 exodeoxyribonuclease V subunit beta [Colwellia hornerae]TWX65058.1 exodeoxyribonuclease V subunit beta [Colwellia hornerae]
MKINNLIAHQIPLQGKHLIEASAGTGKTFNITRLYLRLLLEKQLPVEQILVMTFTKDATEELRGRIDSFIRQALNHWDELIVSDEFFNAISQHIDEKSAKIRLRQALLYLDEAAILTIHGFCKRVLSQHAFASGVAFNAQMETNCQDLVLQACQDWYRVLAKNSPEHFKQVMQFWPNPLNFLSQFSKAIGKHNALDVVNVDEIEQLFTELVQQAVYNLENNVPLLTQYLIDVKKGSEREKRQQELDALIQWLHRLAEKLSVANEKMPDGFIDGKRYARSVGKIELLAVFEPVKMVKEELKSLAKKIEKAKALVIVREGIYQIRANITEQKSIANILSFDDLISTLATCLQAKNSNAQALAQTLFEQYPVALVDEFQDTDPLQFSILEAIYYHQSTAALYMIGDPKQAIYGFRGGDVFAYLSARKDCDQQWLMDTNWRSTPAMIAGYNRLFYGEAITDKTDASQGNSRVFGYDIPYIPVRASPPALAKYKAITDNALQFVHFVDEEAKKSVAQSFRPVMATWCANEIINLLNAPADENNDKLSSKDIAILVRDGAEARDIKQALEQANLASVFMSNRANLMKSEQTEQLIQLLRGILFVENERYFSAAIACDLLDYHPEKYRKLQENELAWQALKFDFEQLRNEWLYKGFISMALKLMHDHFCIADENQDRILTNLLHLFEILQTASQRHRQPQELLYWLEQQSRVDDPEIEAELRLESDDNLIRIITQHGSKGLEYPVVFVPFATRHKDPLKFGASSVTFIEYHDKNHQLKLSLDGSEHAKASMANEAYAEAIRLLYVAVTRAEKRCYILTTAFDKTEHSPLGRALKWQSQQNIEENLRQLVNDEPNNISLVTLSTLANASELIAQQAPLTEASDKTGQVAHFNGKIERDWWLSSFSALSRNLRHGGVSSPDRDNPLEKNSMTDLQSSAMQASSLLRFNLAKGAHTGNLLHDILEHTDFNAPDWQQAMHWPLQKYGALTAGYQAEDLQCWLAQIINSPLGDSALAIDNSEPFSLADLQQGKTLRESEFYYPMRSASTDKLTQILSKHRNMHSQSTQQSIVRLPAYQQLKGMMHGFIDLIFEHNNKYYICDYKSSHLGNDFSDYNQQAMKENIEKNHYDLQYLIYALALHRYLSYSLDNYDVEQHFGGTYYLYLRGMTDDEQHKNCGVYYRKIEAQELAALDQLFLGDE